MISVRYFARLSRNRGQPFLNPQPVMKGHAIHVPHEDELDAQNAVHAIASSGHAFAFRLAAVALARGRYPHDDELPSYRRELQRRMQRMRGNDTGMIYPDKSRPTGVSHADITWY